MVSLFPCVALDFLVLLTAMVAAIGTMSWLFSFFQRRRKSGSAESTSPTMGNTQFFGSQIGGQTVISYSYTDFPWKLLAWDVYYFFHFAWALPYILLPSRPTNSGDLDELAFTWQNLFCILIHAILCILQLGFILCLPFAILFPIWMVAGAVALFFLVNHSLCLLLNGKGFIFHSDPEYAEALPEHSHEQWIFLNGVAVGEHWLKNNLNRLALTFNRPILGVHNRTSGIIFDVVECLIQRNFCYATSDVRICYSILKEKLYNPQYSKVIFILHSQGGIEGGLVLDWLLQELPQNLLNKLETYTFGSAANHFNNPHRHYDSQKAAIRHPLLAGVDSASAGTRSNGHVPTPNTNGDTNGHIVRRRSSQQTRPSQERPSPGNIVTEGHHIVNSPVTAETRSHQPAAVSGRAIGHVEHYAHTTDFVALWGVLHFATSATATHTMPRFIGRVFSRTSERGGHQFCQHYLDGMFPLARGENGNFTGCAETGNEFMESEIVFGTDGDGGHDVREAFESSWLGSREDMTDEERARATEVEIHNPDTGTPIHRRTRPDGRPASVKVKELSRLWKYRNGKKPAETPPMLRRDFDGVVRNATL